MMSLFYLPDKQQITKVRRVKMSEAVKVYDYLVIGGGSGGLASARRAAKYLGVDEKNGNRVGVVEFHRIGGTCVNVGCVPKKLMFETSKLAESLKTMRWFGFDEVALKSVSDEWAFQREALEASLESSALIKALRERVADKQLPEEIKLSHQEEVKKSKKSKRTSLEKLTTMQRQVATGDGEAMQIGFDWMRHKRARDDYIRRLHGIYRAALEREHVDLLDGGATGAFFTGAFVDPETGKVIEKAIQGSRLVMDVNGDKVSAKVILLATGGAPIVPDIPGAREFGITSDEFFALDTQPKRVAIVGSGYIAVELAGIFHALGSHVTVLIRGNTVLRQHFDPAVSGALHEDMLKRGIAIKSALVKSISKDPTTHQFHVALDHGEDLSVDLVMFAVGRRPTTHNLHGENIQLKIDSDGFVDVDQGARTTVDGVYALGDLTRQFPQLTPVAIMAGRRLADSLFNTKKHTELVPFGGELIPTVVFSHPPIATIGMTEPQARELYKDQVKIYTTRFTCMAYGLISPGHADRHLTLFKVVAVLEEGEEYVKGIHLIGEGVDEIIQGFACAMTAARKHGKGLTMDDLRDTVPIHPTSAEEVVTIS